MQKEIMNPVLVERESPVEQSWLDLEQLARVELTSEDEAYPVESALTINDKEGWIAAQPGEQTIRLLFSEPQNIKKIQLVFREEEQARTQEFCLRWLSAGGQSYQEIVRQQYNFSPPHTTEETEDYTVSLDQVSAFELSINPDKSNSGAYASLAKLRLG